MNMPTVPEAVTHVLPMDAACHRQALAQLAAHKSLTFPCALVHCTSSALMSRNQMQMHALYMLTSTHQPHGSHYTSEDGWVHLVHARDELEKLAANTYVQAPTSTNTTMIRVPDLRALKTAIDIGQFHDYQAQWITQVEAIVRHISSSPRVQRKRMGGLVAVYSYVEDMPAFIETLNRLAHFYIDKLYARKTKNETDCRTVDSLLHLIFELSGTQPIASSERVLERLERDYLVTAFEMKMFCRGLRQSFLKGVEYSRRHPRLIARIVAATDSHDADAFRIFEFIVNNMQRYQVSEQQGQQTLEQLFALPKRDIISLVRDLRRTVPAMAELPGSYYTCIANRMAQEIEQGPLDGEIWIARLYAIIFTLGYHPTLLLWISQHHVPLGIASEHVDALHAVCGYDTPYVLRRVLDIKSHQGHFPILATAGHAHIGDYFEANLNHWANIPAVAASSASSPFRVSVILTTFNPNMRMLELSLCSVCMQVGVQLDILLVDDASTQVKRSEFEALANRLEARFSITVNYYRNATNQGQYASRNFAISKARGDYIAIQDDDDISHPQRLLLQISAMQSDNIMASHAQHLRLSEDARFMADGNFIGALEGDGPVTFIWKKQVFSTIGGFVPTRTRGDIEFRRRLQRTHGRASIAVIPLPLVYMRGGLNTISSMKEYVYRSALSALRYMMDHTETEQVANQAAFDCWIPYRLKHA